ncbi:MAG: MFS transporter [Candidatus Puniceispirillaceae bacterium]
MLRSALASWTLFFGLLLIMSGNGLQVVLLGTEATEAGFSKITTGFVMAGYFLGIFCGSLLVPKLLDNVGHVRVFGAMAALASAAVLVVAALVNPVVWASMRILTGFCFAGMYIVCESWLNDQATNETRGQMLSLYMIVSMGGLAIGQLMIGVGGENSIGLFLLASVLVSVAVVPVLLSVGKAPAFEEPERMSLRRLLQVSPLAVVGLGINGMAVSMLFGMGAVYGLSIGLNNAEVGYFMTAPVIGALILQYPVGRLSDRFDRRMVIFGVAVMGAGAAAMATMFGRADFALLLACMLVYGGSLFPLYSLCIAHGNDFLTPRQMVAAASGLVMINGAGAVLGSPLAALSLEYFGVTSFFILVTVIQLMIAGFALFRMTRRAAVPNLAQGPFVAIPESSSAIAATLNPEAEWIAGSDEASEEDDPFHDNPYID